MASNLESDMFHIKSQNSVIEGDIEPTNWVENMCSNFPLNTLFVFGCTNIAASIKSGQKGQIQEQLNNGARFIDLHIASHEGEIWLYHNEPIILLKKALYEIETFLYNKKEKIILRISQSQTSPNQIDWEEVKIVLTCGIHNKFIPKTQFNTVIFKIKYSIIFIAPTELKIEKNWGEEAITHFPSLETTKSKDELNAILSGLKDGPLKDKTDKLVWVECILRGEHSDKRHIEVKAAELNIHQASTKVHLNIITFSSVDDKHFSNFQLSLFSPPGQK